MRTPVFPGPVLPLIANQKTLLAYICNITIGESYAGPKVEADSLTLSWFFHILPNGVFTQCKPRKAQEISRNKSMNQRVYKVGDHPSVAANTSK